MCSDCEGYGLKKHGLTRSDCISLEKQQAGTLKWQFPDIEFDVDTFKPFKTIRQLSSRMNNQAPAIFLCPHFPPFSIPFFSLSYLPYTLYVIYYFVRPLTTHVVIICPKETMVFG